MVLPDVCDLFTKSRFTRVTQLLWVTQTSVLFFCLESGNSIRRSGPVKIFGAELSGKPISFGQCYEQGAVAS